MKTHHLFSGLIIFLIFLFVIRTNCEQISESNLNNNYELDPSDLMPSGVDLNQLTFNDNLKLKSQTNGQENEDNQFINLVNSNLKTALPLRSSNDKVDNFKIQNYNEYPTIVLENVYTNDLTKKEKIPNLNDQTFTNYLPDANTNELFNKFNHLIPKINHHSNKQQTINHLDSKINLNNVLDQLNLFMGSNSGYMLRKQRKLIRTNPGVLAALVKSFRLSLNECKFQFKDHYWNCPTDRRLSPRKMFGNILNRGLFF